MITPQILWIFFKLRDKKHPVRKRPFIGPANRTAGMPRLRGVIPGARKAEQVPERLTLFLEAVFGR